jgi:hypothetical protein
MDYGPGGFENREKKEPDEKEGDTISFGFRSQSTYFWRA